MHLGDRRGARGVSSNRRTLSHGLRRALDVLAGLSSPGNGGAPGSWSSPARPVGRYLRQQVAGWTRKPVQTSRRSGRAPRDSRKRAQDWR